MTGSVWLYFHSTAILRADIQNQLKNYASLAAMEFYAEDIQAIQDGENDEIFRMLVARTERIQETLSDITYVYIMQKVENPMQLEFLVENTMLFPFEKLDRNSDGVLDPNEEAMLPGDLFDISDVSAMQTEAWEGPAVDANITHDMWGSWMSAYAPILDEEGNAIAIIGLDMDADRFILSTKRIFSPTLLFLVVLGSILIIIAFSYEQWRGRILFLEAIDKKRRSIMTIASHKLGGPLATMRWWLDIIDSSPKSTPVNAKQELQTAIDHLYEIVKNLEQATRTELTGEKLLQHLAGETRKKEGAPNS